MYHNVLDFTHLSLAFPDKHEMHFHDLDVTDGQGVRVGVSVTQNVLS